MVSHFLHFRHLSTILCTKRWSTRTEQYLGRSIFHSERWRCLVHLLAVLAPQFCPNICLQKASQEIFKKLCFNKQHSFPLRHIWTSVTILMPIPENNDVPEDSFKKNFIPTLTPRWERDWNYWEGVGDEERNSCSPAAPSSPSSCYQLLALLFTETFCSSKLHISGNASKFQVCYQ